MGRVRPSAEEEVTPEVRRRLEERHGGSTWRIYVCAEPDGENCTSGTGGIGHHECAAGNAARRGGDPPKVAWILVEPVK